MAEQFDLSLGTNQLFLSGSGGTGTIVDSNYSPTSSHAQSGIAVEQAVSAVNANISSLYRLLFNSSTETLKPSTSSQPTQQYGVRYFELDTTSKNLHYTPPILLHSITLYFTDSQGEQKNHLIIWERDPEGGDNYHYQGSSELAENNISNHTAKYTFSTPLLITGSSIRCLFRPNKTSIWPSKTETWITPELKLFDSDYDDDSWCEISTKEGGDYGEYFMYPQYDMVVSKPKSSIEGGVTELTDYLKLHVLANNGTSLTQTLPVEQYKNSSYEVDWGDGTKTTNTNTHTYTEPIDKFRPIIITGDIILGGSFQYFGGDIEVVGKSPIRAFNGISNSLLVTSLSGDWFNNIDITLMQDPVPSSTTWNLSGTFKELNKLKTISDNFFDSIPNGSTTRIDNMFSITSGESSLTHIPEIWNKLNITQHTDCFTGHTNADNYATAVSKGWASQISTPTTTNGIVLGIEFNENDNKTVNLSTFIDRGEYIPDVIIDWGDGSEKLKVNEHEKSYELSHTYTNGLTYDIVIMGETVNATMKVWGIPDTTYNHTENDVRYYLKSISSSASGYHFRTTPISIVNGTAFCKCPKLESVVTSYVFNKCTEQTNFKYCFAECPKLQSIPENLFQYCTKVQNFEHTFENCGLTSIPANLFKNCTEVTNFEKCFNGNTQVTGALPTLWSTHSNATSHTDCFTGCTQATNWNEALSNGWATGTPSPSSSSSSSPSSAVNYVFPRARTVKTASDY